MYPTRYTDPKAVGYLVAEHVRCGKPKCRCGRGKRHGPYWYLYYRQLEGGVWRQRKRYVPAGGLQEVRRRLQANKARDRATMRLFTRSRHLRAAVRKRRQGKITDMELEGICHEITG